MGKPNTIFDRPIGRRDLLKGAGALGMAGLTAPLFSAAKALAGGPSKGSPIKHVVVDMQENRSFDHYYGFAQFVGGYGVPAGYSQPDGNGGVVKPYHFASLSTPDIGHSLGAMHSEYDGGKMDGFYTTDGINCLGYYTQADLPFYYSLFQSSTLCTNYFSSLMGPTWPNRFYLAAGTSGGITTNGIWGYGVFDYPIILDLLEDAGVSWKVYNVSMDSIPFGNTDNVFVFWKRWAHDQRTRASKGEYLDDLRLGRLPQVSFIIPSFAHGWDEHPPADVSVGMGIQQELITALMQSSAWNSSTYILTYDEAGGYFDHVPPPQLDAFGLGIRLPTWVISPWAKPGHLEPTLYEHSSVLKFIEAVFALPTLASVNHAFDASTPTGFNYEAGGPPAPPRDGRREIGNLMECFAF
jgi:phospholipase C